MAKDDNNERVMLRRPPQGANIRFRSGNIKFRGFPSTRYHPYPSSFEVSDLVLRRLTSPHACIASAVLYRSLLAQWCERMNRSSAKQEKLSECQTGGNSASDMRGT